MRGYLTEDSAARAVDGLIEHAPWTAERLARLRVYRCPRGTWHVTSLPDGEMELVPLPSRPQWCRRCRKRAYKTEFHARSALRTQVDGGPDRVYQCPVGWWHLTSKPLRFPPVATGLA